MRVPELQERGKDDCTPNRTPGTLRPHRDFAVSRSPRNLPRLCRARKNRFKFTRPASRSLATRGPNRLLGNRCGRHRERGVAMSDTRGLLDRISAFRQRLDATPQLIPDAIPVDVEPSAVVREAEAFQQSVKRIAGAPEVAAP